MGDRIPRTGDHQPSQVHEVNGVTIKLIHAAPSTSDAQHPVPRWALRTAYAIPLLLLPSCLWRPPFAFHFKMGQIHDADATMGPLWLSIP
ncbi:hypothetical protein [Actinomadura sp. 9N407]|uniref:hypothetical protein n=1 Tax=Actinomadura sp. 9N407 TaxID=3375154 RepID=UPI0037AE5E75